METHIQASDLEPLIRALAGDQTDTLLSVLASPAYPSVLNLMFELVEMLCADQPSLTDPVRGVVRLSDEDLIGTVQFAANTYEKWLLERPDAEQLSEQMESVVEYSQFMLAQLLQTIRTPLTWDELTEHERGPAESMMGQLVMRPRGAWQTFPQDLLPAPGRPVEFSFKLVLLWSRAEGCAPDWFIEHFCEEVGDDEEDEGEDGAVVDGVDAEAEEPAIAASGDKPS